MPLLRTTFSLLDRLSLLLARASIVLVVAMTVAMVAALVLQIVFRYGFGQALTWSEEAALFLFTWIVLLAGSLGVREGFHVRLTLVRDALPPVLRRPLDRLLTAMVAGFGAVLLVAGRDYVAETVGQVSAAVGYPIEALHLAAPVCGALILLHALAALLRPGGTADAMAPPAVGRE